MNIKYKSFALLSTILVLFTLFSGFGVNATSNEDDSDLLKDPALYTTMDYAKLYNVTLDEAKRRLGLQPIIGKFDGLLRSNEKETFAGLWIEHEPTFGVVVLFTQNGEKTIQSYIPPELIGMVQVKNAETTLNELEIIQDKASTDIQSLDIHADSEIDVYTNRVKVYVTEQPKLDEALLNRQIIISEKVDVVSVKSLSTTQTDIYGGLALSYNSTPCCTSGFSWTDGASPETRGISTAGHCEDGLSYNGDVLGWVTDEDSGSCDFQIHTVPAGYTVTNKIQYYSGYTCNITGTLGRDNQSIGMYVAKYGIATGRTAGHISSLSFQPDGPYSSTFIRVNNTWENNLSSINDSGGPWYDGYYGIAYGIHRGEPGDDTNDAIFMAINYMEALGFNVLTSP